MPPVWSVANTSRGIIQPTKHQGPPDSRDRHPPPDASFLAVERHLVVKPHGSDLSPWRAQLVSTRSCMSFDVGDKVVYPHHGAAVIERRERREVFGTDREYLVLRVAHDGLTLSVPADNTAEVGLREVINDEEILDVLAVLAKKGARTPSNWSRRFKNHTEKLKSGDIYQVGRGGAEPVAAQERPRPVRR